MIFNSLFWAIIKIINESFEPSEENQHNKADKIFNKKITYNETNEILIEKILMEFERGRINININIFLY